MASKCWFVLSQTHYPPPTIPEHGVGVSSGPICLGHLIPDLRHLDNVINRQGPLEFPPNMPVHSTKAWGLEKQLCKSSGVGLSAAAGVPIAAAAGLTIQCDAGVAFQTTTNNFWEFESLETFIIQPTKAYIKDTLKSREAVQHLDEQKLIKPRSLFMITGIIVARGASVNNAENQSRGIQGGPGVELPMIAEMGTQIEFSKGRSTSSSAKSTTDFVWAVRLAKISKGFLDRRWSFETLSRGATFSSGADADFHRDIREALKDEGLDVDTTGINANDDMFIAGSEESISQQHS